MAEITVKELKNFLEGYKDDMPVRFEYKKLGRHVKLKTEYLTFKPLGGGDNKRVSIPTILIKKKSISGL